MFSSPLSRAGRVHFSVQAAYFPLHHHLAALHGNHTRIHLHHGHDRHQVTKADIQVADYDLVPCGPGRQAEDFIQNCRDAATVGMSGRALGNRAEPDPCNQVALSVTEVFHPETIAGLVSRDETQGFPYQGRSVERLPFGFSIKLLFSHLVLLKEKGTPHLEVSP